jgi:hypothetical protein
VLPRWRGTSRELQLVRLSHRSDVWEEARGSLVAIPVVRVSHIAHSPRGLSQMNCDVSTLGWRISVCRSAVARAWLAVGIR